MGNGNNGLSEAGRRRLREVLEAHVESKKIPGLVALVGRGEETHVEAIGTMRHDGGTPMRRDTIFRMASTTKPVAVAATMVLLDECRLRLDEPIDHWLPELADRRVLKRPDSPLDDTVPARRPITVRDLLTSTCGLGLDTTAMGSPMMSAYFEQKVYGENGWMLPAVEPDEWMRRLGTLPLMYQPGERWLYNVSDDVLGVLVARVTGQSFESFLRERIFDPLGMKDTGFHVPTDKIDRLPPLYAPDPQTGEFTVEDQAGGGHHSKPRAAGHEGDRRPGDQSLGVRDEPLVVPRVAAGVHHPRERPLDDPAAGQHDEAGGVLGTADRLDREVEVLFRPVHELPGIGGIGPHDRDLGMPQTEAEQHFLRRGGVVQVGRGDHDHQGKTAGVDDQVTLAATR